MRGCKDSPVACRRVRRLLVPLVLLVVVAAVVVGAFTIPSTAATVNGATITSNQLAEDLSDISASPTYQCYLNANILVRTGGGQLPSVEGVGGAGTGNTGFVDYWLGQLVSNRLIEQLVAARHLSLTTADLAVGRADLLESINATLATAANDEGQEVACAPSAQDVLDSMPASFIGAQVRAQAAGDVLLAAAAGYDLSTESVDRYFNAHASDFDTLCVTAVETSDESTATQLQSEVQAGTPLADLAKTSTSDASAAESACIGASSLSYATISADLDGVAVGGVTQPLPNQSGDYLLFQLTKRTPATFSKVQGAVREALLASGDQKASAELASATNRARVTIDPRYGRWVPGSSITIDPPTSPPANTILSSGADQPS